MKQKILFLLLFLFNVFLLYSQEVEIYPDKRNQTTGNCAVILPEENCVLSSFQKPNLYTVDMNTGSVEKLFPEKDLGAPVVYLELSNDGKYIFCETGSNSYGEELIILDRKNFDILKSYEVNNIMPQVRHFTISSFDCRYLGFEKPGKKFTVVDLQSLNEILEIPIEESYVSGWSFSSDSRVIVTTVNALAGTVIPKLYNISDGKLIKSFDGELSVMLFLPKNDFIVSDNSVYDAKTLRFIKNLSLGFGWSSLTKEEYFIFRGNDKVSLSKSDFGSTSRIAEFDDYKYNFMTSFGRYCLSENEKFYCEPGMYQDVLVAAVDLEKQTIKSVFKTMLFDDDEWISLTPDGYYNASPKGDEHLNIRYGMDAFGINQFSKAYYHPEVITARINGNDDPAVVSYFGDIKLNAAPPVIKAEAAVKDDKADLSITIIDALFKYPFNSIQLFVNGRMLGSSELQKLKEKDVHLAVENTSIIPNEKDKNVINFDIEIELENGKNIVEVLVDNDSCYGMETIELYSQNKIENQIKPDLWVYSIGINDYKALPQSRGNNENGLVDLQNAVGDSDIIVNLFSSQEQKKYNKVHVLQISDKQKLKPSKKIILDNIKFFSDMKPNDVALLFIAAHGVSVNGEFYILPNDVDVDESGMTPDLSHCIKTEDILGLTNLQGRKIILIDTCQSGGIDNNIIVRTLKSRSTVIFTAAKENELAQESEDIGGHFTHSIEACFKEKENSDIYINDLADYVDSEVKQLSRFGGRGKIRQHPEIIIPDGMMNYIVAQ